LPDRPSTAARAIGHALGRVNDRASATLDAVFVPMWRIGFLIIAGGADARPAKDAVYMILHQQKVKLNFVRWR
jgi:hypothetical protein